MQSAFNPVTKDLVLLGGGHSHLFVLRYLAMHPIPGVRITLITRDINTPYSGMLPGYIAGHYQFDETHIDLRPLARFAGANLVHAEISNLHVDNGRIEFADRPSLAFDLLSINIGSRPTPPPELSAAAWQVGVKPIDQFLKQWQLAEEKLKSSPDDLRVVVVGGGAGGVELALSLQHRVSNMPERQGRLALSLVTNANVLLPSHNARVQSIFAQLFKDRGIPVVHNQQVTGFDGKQLLSNSETRIDADLVVWVTQASAAGWLKETSLALDEHGFIRVNAALQSLSHDNVFAAGDIASVADHVRPKSGVFAVRQGIPLAKNLARVANGRQPKAFRPQRHFLSLISTGDKSAVTSRGGLALQGDWCWTWKDWIDRRFMERFQVLPEMQPDGHDAAGDITPMRCAGCGSKIGSDVLERVLQALDPDFDAAIRIEDAASIKVPAGNQLLQSVDYFRSFTDDLYLFGRITALHALGDLFAMGVKPHSAQVLATVRFASEEKQFEDLLQLMTGVVETLNEHQVTLIGGHSSEAQDSACGLTVNGFHKKNASLLTKAGLQDGDCLVQLKPLGSGVLFAADMRGKARGDWIDTAFSTLLQSSWPAVATLQQYEASACTDITGFGLLGHLHEMLRASNKCAELELASVTSMPGVLQLIEQGVQSSLAPQNKRLRRIVDCSEALGRSPLYALLFDPQTAGGLLAGIPAAQASACLQALHELGFVDARLIGRVLPAGESGPRVSLL